MDSVSSRQFREFRDFSAIAENHWPYNVLQMAVRYNAHQYSMQQRNPCECFVSLLVL